MLYKEIYKKDGYVFCSGKNHPFCPKTGYIKRSRLVMELFLGRYLKQTEIVHHINGIKDDDRIENLKLYKSNAEHIKENHTWGCRPLLRKYRRIETKNFPDPEKLNYKIVFKKITYVTINCFICKKLFWTKLRTERPNTKTCSKKCFVELMKGVSYARDRGFSGVYR